MNVQSDFFLEIIQFLVFIPAAAICYMPMKNQLKRSGVKIFMFIAGAFLLFVPAAAACSTWLGVSPDITTLIVLTALFLCFHGSVKADISRSLTVYLFSCNLSAFPADFAYTFDAWLHPNATYAEFSAEAALFQLALTSVLALLLVYPLRKYGSKLVDTLFAPRSWIAVASITTVFLLLSIAIIPRNYSTLYVGRCFPLYISILIGLLILMGLLYTAFYSIVMGMHENFRLTERVQFFELEEKQYLLQKAYIEETSKQRHDFRQSFFALKRLADTDDLAAVKKYLTEYEPLFPAEEIQHFCANNAVNALLNHYAGVTAENHILIKWNVDLPEVLAASEPDMCSLIGNLIENAVAGCLTLDDADKRYHYLSVTVSNNVNLYVVSTNSFNGVVKMKDKHYLSTKKNSRGIGLRSARMIAEKYHGTARFYHTGTEFCSDVMLRLSH